MLYAEKIQYFIEVVRHGSFSRAAKTLGVVTSTVTKTVTLLEKEVAQTLVKRLKSGVELTEVGQDFYESVIESYLAIEHKFNNLRQSEKIPTTTLKIITTAGSMGLWLTERLVTFRDQYPEVTIRVMVTDDPVSLSKTDADVAILPGVEDAGAVVKRKLFSAPLRLAASKEYIAKHGMPQTKEDLKNHFLLGYYHSKGNIRGNVDWHLHSHGDLLHPSFIVNSGLCMYHAVKLGLGIAPVGVGLPIDGNLIQILQNEAKPNIDIFFITHKRSSNPILDRLYLILAGETAAEIKGYL